MTALGRLTDDQRAVVTGLERNFCVTSGAGCGKTRVLVERYIHYLDEDTALPLGRLAAITFTENAAAEMRDRIRGACRTRIAEARREDRPRDLGRWLARYWDVDVAPINTIHGFCASLLREWPIEAGIDPNFTVLDDATAVLLAEDTIGGCIEELLGADDEAIVAVLEHFDLRTLREVLAEIVLQKRDELRRVAGPALARSDEAILADLHKAVAGRLRAALDESLAGPEVVEAIRTIETLHGDPADKLEPIRAEAASRLANLRRARTAKPAAGHARWIAENVRLTVGSAKLWPSKDDLQAAKDALKTVREALKEALESAPAFDKDFEREHLALARALYVVAERAVADYDAAKRDRSALDFEDLQIGVRDLLRDRPRVLAELRKRFRAVLVDELQDTNFLQFEIVERLASGAGRGGNGLRPGAFFGVGDPKQSIYRFRGAEVEVFDAARPRVGRAGQRGLEESWRLHPGLAALVNDVFGRLMGDRYDPIEGMHRQVNDYVGELLYVTNPKAPDGFRAEEGLTEEARTLADGLRRMVENGEVRLWDRDRDETRPATYGDVAILLRRTSYLHLFEEALEREGVPYLVVAGGGFYKQQEVIDALNLLRVLDDPADELHLAGVLRSPFFAVSDEGLLRLRRLGGTLGEALGRAGEAPGMDAADRDGCERAARRLAEWAEAKDRLGLAALVDRVVFGSGYAASAVGRFGGERAYANLRQMVELARSFERQGLESLGDYVVYVSDFMRSEMRQEQAPVESPGAEAVRLMTIHKAKGLEFPIVVVPDLGFASQAPRSPCRIHPSTGLAVRMRDAEGDRRLSAALAMARLDEIEAERQESLRVLYVAMTRARDFLVPATHALYKRKSGTWQESLFEALRQEDLPEADGEVVLSGGHRMRLRVTSPPKRIARHQKRRVGPRDVITEGRISWERLAARRSGAAADHARERLEACQPPPGADPLPPRVAATSLDTYRRCPRHYWWTHVAGLDACEPEPPAEAGLSVRKLGALYHRALELARSPDADAVRSAVDGALRELDAGSDDAGRRLRPAVERVVQTFWASDLGRRVARAKQVHRELPVLLQVDGTEVAGTIDLLFEDAHGRWELVDYKSGDGCTSEEAAARYRLQLGLYALAASRWLGRPIDRWSLYFLASSAAVGEALSSADLERAQAEARAVLADIAAGCFEPGDRQACPRCPAVPVCRP